MTVRYSKDPTTLQHPASILKMMTALVVRDWINDAALDDIVVVDSSDEHPPTTAQLRAGDLISLRDLFYGMMVPSGNDAALALSRVVGTQILQSEGVQGDPRTRFLQAMADKAEDLDLQGAVFETPHGGGADSQSRLSAEHSIKLLTECHKDPTLIEIMSAQSREITITGVNARTYTVHHTIDVDGPVYLPEFVMGKTGTHVTAGAGYCVAIVWSNPVGGLRATVVMNSSSPEERFLDLRKLMDLDIAQTLPESPPEPTPTLPTVIGEAYGGGYYIGDIVIADGGADDGVYVVIMAGVESQVNLAWVGTSEAPPLTGANSLTNGKVNTDKILLSDNHLAAAYCRDYPGGGFDDWYLPAEREVNLAWGNRAKLTSLALGTVYYWSSTEAEVLDARRQWFGNGGIETARKALAASIRPVRRIKRS